MKTNKSETANLKALGIVKRHAFFSFAMRNRRIILTTNVFIGFHHHSVVCYSFSVSVVEFCYRTYLIIRKINT